MNIESTEFGSITIDGEKHDHDIVIYPDKFGERKKWITKERHGTSHKFAREEMEGYLDRVDTEKLKVILIGRDSTVNLVFSTKQNASSKIRESNQLS